jgi:choline dehydrogenase-like flavoprotein
MIQNADEIVHDAVIHANICIVGGGLAGITLALQPVRAGKSILLLESGDCAPTKEAQALNAGQVVDAALHSPPDTYRQRVLGGGTSIWGGRCVPFDPMDFDTRPWVDHSGWPIGYDDVEQHYAAANALCEAGDYEYDARIRPRTNLFSLDFHAEQVLNPHSRIGLAAATDRFGNRKVQIDWRYSRQDVETVAKSFELLRDDLSEQSIGRLALAADEADTEAVVRRDGAYGGHHIGTARMGSSACTGVIDRDGKVFGVNNLYLAGSAAFPTSSQANPTLTIVAMALRLADHLGAVATRVVSLRATEQTAMVN